MKEAVAHLVAGGTSATIFTQLGRSNATPRSGDHKSQLLTAAAGKPTDTIVVRDQSAAAADRSCDEQTVGRIAMIEVAAVSTAGGRRHAAGFSTTPIYGSPRKRCAQSRP
jgi:hypothetical protein